MRVGLAYQYDSACLGPMIDAFAGRNGTIGVVQVGTGLETPAKDFTNHDGGPRKA